MLPEFNQHGFLPEGIWNCDFVEFAKRFAVFRRSDRRLLLFEKLENLLTDCLATGWIQEVIIDGSFVTDKNEPNDIDLILVLLPDFEDAEISFWTSRVLDEKSIRKKYDFDVKTVVYKSLRYNKTIDFFQQIRDSDERKGLVRLVK